MKKVFIAVGCLVLMAAGCQLQKNNIPSQEVSTTQTYTDSEWQISLTLPKPWTIRSAHGEDALNPRMLFGESPRIDLKNEFYDFFVRPAILGNDQWSCQDKYKNQSEELNLAGQKVQTQYRDVYESNLYTKESCFSVNNKTYYSIYEVYNRPTTENKLTQSEVDNFKLIYSGLKLP